MPEYTYLVLSFAVGFFVSLVAGKLIKTIISAILALVIALLAYLRFFS